MKKVYIGLIVLVFSSILYATISPSIKSRPNAYWWSGSSRDTAWQWSKEVEDILNAGLMGSDPNTITFANTATISNSSSDRIVITANNENLQLISSSNKWTLGTSTGVTAIDANNIGLSNAGAVSINGNTTLGDASTDTITCVGRLILRTVAADPTGTATAGTLNEIVVYNGKVYLKITGSGTDTNWAALN